MPSFTNSALWMIGLAILSMATPSDAGESQWPAILAEATRRSEVREILVELSDVRGPRLTGTRNFYEAARWSRDRLQGWGVEAQLEPLATPVRGWEAKRVSVSLVTPHSGPLSALPVSWSGSTGGRLTGIPLAVDFDTLDDLEAARRYDGRLNGRIILLRAVTGAAPNFERGAMRWSPTELAGAHSSTEIAPDPGFYFTPSSNFPAQLNSFVERREKQAAVEVYLKKQGVAAILIPSVQSHGLLNTGSTSPLMLVGDAEAPPEIVIAAEHAGRLHRLIERGIEPKVEVESTVRYVHNPAWNVNVTGEIRGGDMADEYVLIGAHLDSEAAGTGAIDNGSGAATMLEAMRILRAIGAQPRRSIRIGLWNGEEQGYIGVLEYVRKNLGDPVSGSRRPGHDKIAAYLNLDHGTGRVRGVYLQGNQAWREFYQAHFEPMAFLGISTITLQATSGSDHFPFDSVNVPAFQFIQDLIDLDTATGHTQLDSVDHAIEEDLQINAAFIAATALSIANLDTLPPRRNAVPVYGPLPDEDG